jgi:hypothetical protein
MATSLIQAAKVEIVSLVGLSKDALHIYAGLLIFISAAAILKKPLRAAIPLVLVLLVAVVGEIFDARDDIAGFGHWRAVASLHDILNTLFWPAVLFVVARYTQLLK